MPIPSAQAQTNGGRPFPSSPSVRSTRGARPTRWRRRTGLAESVRDGGWQVANGPGRTTRNIFQQHRFGEPLRIGPSPGELRVDAKAEAEGASPSVEPSGGESVARTFSRSIWLRPSEARPRWDGFTLGPKLRFGRVGEIAECRRAIHALCGDVALQSRASRNWVPQQSWGPDVSEMSPARCRNPAFLSFFRNSSSSAGSPSISLPVHLSSHLA